MKEKTCNLLSNMPILNKIYTDI